jgi:alpha-beta hydrolase superfamily lysophospholipase
VAADKGELTVRDGIALRTRHWSCDEPKGRVLLVHGLAEHCGRWEHVGEYLAGRGYDTWAYDWRGHGESGGPRGHADSFEDMVEDLEEVFASLPDDRPRFIYGHSMGGLIATTYAVSDREQPDAFVLSAPALAADLPAPLRVAARILPKFAPKLRLKSPIEGEHLSRDPAVADRYFADPLLQLSSSAQFGNEALRTMEATRRRLSRIRVPTLVVHGAEDELIAPAASAPLAAVPVVKRRLFAGLRHEIHNEPEQDQVLGEIVDWLDAQVAG